MSNPVLLRNLKHLFKPRSVAVIGASEKHAPSAGNDSGPVQDLHCGGTMQYESQDDVPDVKTLGAITIDVVAGTLNRAPAVGPG